MQGGNNFPVFRGAGRCLLLCHGPCNDYFRLTADTGRPGAEGGATASTLLKLLLPDLILRNQAIIKHYFRMVV